MVGKAKFLLVVLFAGSPIVAGGCLTNGFFCENESTWCSSFAKSSCVQTGELAGEFAGAVLKAGLK